MNSLSIKLVRLLPRAFRDQFGGDIVEQIQRDYVRARSQGRLHTFGFVVVTTLDLIRTAVAERLSPTWSAPSERGRQENIEMRMNDWSKNLKQAVRSMQRSPGFFAISVGMLALAIGANAGIFSVVDAVLLNPLPYPETDRLVYLAGTAPGTDLPDEFRVSSEFFVHYREHSELLEDVSTYNTFTATLRDDDRAERVWMSMPTTSMFSTLGVTPILGRLPTPEDDDRVCVISHTLWTTWFGADPGILGRVLEVIGEPRTVIGVMGPDFWFPNERVLLWAPHVIRPEEITPGRFGHALVARVAPGVEQETLVEELGRLAQGLPERFGGSASYARVIERYRPVVKPLEEVFLGAVAGPLWVLLGSVGIVLLIACANVANLFMVRGERRQRELAIRRALGAARGHLIRAQMAEALVVAAIAGVVALAIAYVGIPVFLQAAPPNLPRVGQAGLTITTMVFTAAVSLFAAFLCGLLPAVRSSGTSLTRLRDGGRGSTRRQRWGQNGLVVAQTALALVLLIGSGLLVRSLQALRNVDPGYDVEDVFTFQIAPEGSHLEDAPSFARFHMDFMERLKALPSVESVGVVENVPLNEGVRDRRFQTEDSEGGPDTGTPLSITWAGGDYFRTMGIDVTRGRTFTRADHISDLGNIVVSETAANLLWPGQDPIGRRVKREDVEAWETVVGVVEDILQYEFRDAPEPLVYLPLVGPSTDSRSIVSPAYVLKTKRADDIAPEVRALVRDVAPHVPMYRVYTMQRLAAESMVRLSFTVLTLLIASGLALILGTVGLYGVLSYVVTERRQELGVRLALGAGARRVQKMVVAQGARIVTLGIAIGMLVSVGVTRVLGTLLFGVGAIDAVTFFGMAVTMIAVGLLASYIPARRASSVDLIESLRID